MNILNSILEPKRGSVEASEVIWSNHTKGGAQAKQAVSPGINN